MNNCSYVIIFLLFSYLFTYVRNLLSHPIPFGRHLSFGGASCGDYITRSRDAKPCEYFQGERSLNNARRNLNGALTQQRDYILQRIKGE